LYSHIRKSRYLDKDLKRTRTESQTILD